MTLPSTMKALRLTKFNQNYLLRKDIPVPVAGEGEVLVRVRAASFCHTDYQVYQGVYGTTLPITPSHEPVGTVSALGVGVRGDWQLGDRVGVLNFRKPCGKCAGCKWQAITNTGTLDARYCNQKTMAGILGADGGFAEYLIAPDYTLAKLPDSLSFEQAAPLMCAGATVWNAIQQVDTEQTKSIAIVGIGGLGLLGVQMAKALGYRVAAIDNRDFGLKQANQLPEKLRPDLILEIDDSSASEKLLSFTNGIGLDAAVVCTDSVPANDWILHRLRIRGTCVVLGLPEEGFHFDAFNVVFRELVIRGTLHSSMKEVQRMLETVAKHNILSHVTVIELDEAEAVPEKVAAHEFNGRLVVKL